MSSAPKLRSGFSTGACATAAARAAYNAIKSDISDVGSIDILFPDGKYRTMQVTRVNTSKSSASYSIIKDAGDDPDVTHGSLITAQVKLVPKVTVGGKDYTIESGSGGVIIRGGEGVGFVTKDGLDCTKGKYAINPGPRKMIVDNLNDICEIKEWVLVEISVKDGANIAKKTLNPRLGVVGGISILGNSGIVEPYSHSAYIETIKIHLRSAALNHADDLVLSTGVRTLKLVQSKYADIPEENFIRIGDFISDALKYAGKTGFKKVIVSCMAGKLFKYYCGYKYTHAHTVQLKVDAVRPILEKFDVSGATIEKCCNSPTVREALELLPNDTRVNVIQHLGEGALENCINWLENEDAELEILCFDSQGNLVGKWGNIF